MGRSDLPDQVDGGSKIIGAHDHREEHPDVVMLGGVEGCQQLRPQQVLLPQRESQSAQAQVRVCPCPRLEKSGNLVAAQIECADHQRMTCQGLGGTTVRLVLIRQRRRLVRREEQLGPEQLHALEVMRDGIRDLAGTADVGAKADADSIKCCAW